MGVCGLGFGVQVLGFNVWALGFNVWVLGFGIWLRRPKSFCVTWWSIMLRNDYNAEEPKGGNTARQWMRSGKMNGAFLRTISTKGRGVRLLCAHSKPKNLKDSKSDWASQ